MGWQPDKGAWRSLSPGSSERVFSYEEEMSSRSELRSVVRPAMKTRLKAIVIARTVLWFEAIFLLGLKRRLLRVLSEAQACARNDDSLEAIVNGEPGPK